jgi:hypothetical protein
VTITARQQLADTVPLIVPQTIASHLSAPTMLTRYESHPLPVSESPK